MEKLLSLIGFEQEIQNIKASSDLEISLKHSFSLPFTHRNIMNIDIELKLQGRILYTKMNKVFIHQVGKRLYGDRYQNEYYPLFQAWVKDLNENYKTQIIKIKDAIIKHNLILKYYTLNNRNILYGVVSEKFEPTDQLSFRNKFIEVAKSFKNIRTDNTSMYKVSSSIISPVKEYFNFSVPNSNVELKCGIVYGLNNGYGAYSVHWLRIIKDSGTSLTPWKSEQDFQWRNNPRFHDDSSNDEMIKFVEYIVNQGLSHSEYIEKIIIKSHAKALGNNEIEKFMSLITIAEATKIRIRNLYSDEILSKGNTLFSFSESIRQVGTFDKYTARDTKRLLIEIGTNILEEEGVKVRIDDGANIALTGNYDWY